MRDTVLGLELVERCNVRHAVVCNELCDSSVTAEDVLKDEVHESATCFSAKHMSFWVRAE